MDDTPYTEAGIDWLAGVRAVAIERGAKRVQLDDGRSLGYDTLILATGARARRLDVPGAELPGVLTLRGIDDARRIATEFQSGRRLAVVGGGYVGLEVAASARALGLEVVVIEREPRLLARVASPELGAFFERAHRERGVDVRVDARVAAFSGEDRVSGVVLDDGREIPCDAALVGIGAIALDHIAREAGLPCENGIVVDLEARTADPAIYAIGDAAFRPLPLYGGRQMRLESVPNALEQARRAACSILGLPLPAHEVPWFWSDQYDLKLQIAGLPLDCDTRIVRGNAEAGRFSIFHLQGDRVRACEAVNLPQDFVAAKQFIVSGAPVDVAKLADVSIKAKDAVRAA